MALKDILEKMDIPVQRKYLNKSNVKWLLKNLGERNATHPDYEKAMLSLSAIKTNKTYLN